MNPRTDQSSAPRVHLVGGFSVDAALYADGSFRLRRPGGNALWAAIGSHLAGANAVAHSVIGRAFDRRVLAEVADAGVDISGVRSDPDIDGLRVSYSYSADGVRTQPANPPRVALLDRATRQQFVDTTQIAHEISTALPGSEDLNAAESDTADGWHLGLLPVDRCRELLAVLSARGVYVQTDCPARSELALRGDGVLADILPDTDVFLPSTSDTDVFAPGRSRREIIRRFHELGARVVVLKCGADGALLSEQGGGVWQIPVFSEPAAIDPTGCGDVFGGAFAAAVTRGDSLIEAACAGAAAASFATAYQDPIELAGVHPQLVAGRATALGPKVVAL